MLMLNGIDNGNELLAWFMLLILSISLSSFVSSIKKSPQKSDNKVEIIDLKKSKKTILDAYNAKIKELAHDPESLEKYVSNFEEQCSIGKKMYILMINLEADQEKQNIPKNTVVNPSNLHRPKGGGLSFSRDNIEVTLHTAKDKGYAAQERDLDIMVDGSVVASYSTKDDNDDFLVENETQVNVYMDVFKPDMWLFELDDIYMAWLSEKNSLLSEAEKNDQIDYQEMQKKEAKRRFL
jgi:hypothetical protein